MVKFLVPSIVLLTGVLASASHTEPAKAKKFRAELVTAYEECGGSNTLTSNLRPACANPTRSDPLCGFGARGSGVVEVTAIPGDLAVKAKLKGLDSGCEGTTLHLTLARVRVTLDDCQGTSCTMLDGMAGLGSCTVSDGRCSITTTVNTLTPGSIGTGKRNGIEISGCTFMRGAGSEPLVSPFRCGLFVP